VECPQIHLDALAAMEYLDGYEIVSQRRMSTTNYPLAIASTNHPQSGTDDAIQRIYIFLTSILLIGYTAQSASIGLHQDEYGQVSIPSQGYEALQAATGFFLIAKGVRLLQLLWYAWYLPKFRSSHLVQVAFTLIPSIIFFRLLNVDTLLSTMEIFVLGLGLDLLGKYIAGILVNFFGSRRQHIFIPALEIGHVIERTTAFYVLVAGEILLSASYVATESEIGIRGEWVRSCLGVMLAFWLCWVRHQVDLAKYFLIISPSSTLMPTPPGSSAMHCVVTGSHPLPGRRLAFYLNHTAYFSSHYSSTFPYVPVS
jgi:hypothetical protein